MFAVVGVVGAMLLAVAVVWIFSVAGNRGRAQSSEDRKAAERGLHTAPHEPARTEGRGDL